MTRFAWVSQFSFISALALFEKKTSRMRKEEESLNRNKMKHLCVFPLCATLFSSLSPPSYSFLVFRFTSHLSSLQDIFKFSECSTPPTSLQSSSTTVSSGSSFFWTSANKDCCSSLAKLLKISSHFSRLTSCRRKVFCLRSIWRFLSGFFFPQSSANAETNTIKHKKYVYTVWNDA